MITAAQALTLRIKALLTLMQSCRGICPQKPSFILDGARNSWHAGYCDARGNIYVCQRFIFRHTYTFRISSSIYCSSQWLISFCFRRFLPTPGISFIILLRKHILLTCLSDANLCSSSTEIIRPFHHTRFNFLSTFIDLSPLSIIFHLKIPP